MVQSPDVRPTPEQYTPPLTTWGSTWRWLAMLATSGIVWGMTAKLQLAGPRWLTVLDLSFGLVSFALVTQRRRWPFPIAAILTLMGFVSASSAGPGLLALVSVATRRNVRQLVALGLLGIAGSQVYAQVQPQSNDDPPFVTLGFAIVFTILMIAIGMNIGSRRELLWSLRERAIAAETQQELRLDQARSAERERIAREMHDVLAHRISLITMHSGALAYRDDLTRDQVRESAELIQSKAHEALEDLRDVLGSLRQDGGERRPQPTYADLPALIDEATESGTAVAYDEDVDRVDELPLRVGRTVYRVVQEGLTNARKHAPGSHVRVRVQGGPEDGITITVRNPNRAGEWQAAPVSGLGLVGLRERAQLVGGSLEVLKDRESFTLRCWLPWPP